MRSNNTKLMGGGAFNYMEREILFRGKGVNDGRWYYGYYVKQDRTTYCITEDYTTHPDNTIHLIAYDRMTDWGLPNEHKVVEVNPETIGQCTGRTDKNSRRIFEGDIVKGKVHTYTDYQVRTGVVKYYIDAFKMKIGNEYKEIPFTCEIVGYLYDNPEILEE